MGILASLILPLCGYCGVVNRSRSAMWFFITCSGVMATVFAVSLALSLVALGGDVVACACRPGCGAAAGLGGDVAALCASAHYYRSLFWVSVALGAGMAALQLAGCATGVALVRSPFFKAHSPALPLDAPVMATTIVYEQPQAQTQTQAGAGGGPGHGAGRVVYISSPRHVVYRPVYGYADGWSAGPAPQHQQHQQPPQPHRSRSDGAPARYTYAAPPPPPAQQQAGTRSRASSQPEPGAYAGKAV